MVVVGQLRGPGGGATVKRDASRAYSAAGQSLHCSAGARDLRVCEWGQVGCVSAPRWYQQHHHISIFTTWARVGASGLLRGAPPRSGAIMLGQRLQC